MSFDRGDGLALVAIVLAGTAGAALFGVTSRTTTTTTTVTIDSEAPRLVITANDPDRAAEPLVYVDGVRVEGMPDMSPDLIDRIEILKGEAAIRMYGDEARNGVVQIFLKGDSDELHEEDREGRDPGR